MSHNNLALLYNGEGQFKKAEAAHQMSLDILIKLANRHPNVPEYQHNLAMSHYNLAVAYRNAKRFDDAEREHKVSLTIWKELAGAHPDVPEYQRWQYNAASNFVWMVARYPGRSEKDYAEALRLAEMCVEQRPKESDSWQVLGWARYRNGQWQPAIDALETSIELQKNKGDAWQWIFLSMAHWQLGNKAEAHEWYVKSIARRTKSKNEEWLRFRNEARELLGMPVVVGHTDDVESIVFLPDGAGLWSASSDETIKQWGVASRKCLGTLTEHTDKVESLAVSADGKTVASASKDNTIRLWNAQTGTLRHTLGGHAKAVRAVAFSPDGKSLVSVSLDMTVRLWDTASGKLIRELGRHEAGLRAVAFSPTGKLVASAGDDQKIMLWNPHGESEKPVAALSGHTAEIRGLAFSPDGRLLASVGGKKGSKNTDWTARVWDVAARQSLHVLTGHTGAVRTVAFSPDGQTLATGSYDKTVKLWHVEEGQIQTTLEGHADTVRTVAFSPDGKTLAVGGAGIKLWDLATRQAVTFPQITSSLEEAKVNSQGREPLEDKRTQRDQP